MIKCRKCGRSLPRVMFDTYKGTCHECKLRTAEITIKNLKAEVRATRRGPSMWTQVRLRRLIRIMPLGLSEEETERRIGVPYSACKYKAVILGIRRPRLKGEWTDQELYRLWFLRRIRGMSFSAAATSMGYPNPQKDRNILIGAWNRHIKGKENQFELVHDRRHRSRVPVLDNTLSDTNP